jgi:uncharacterized membrane protein
VWDLLDALLELATWFSWRVWVGFLSGLLIGVVFNFAFAESSTFMPMFFAILGILPGYVWHRRSQND